MVGPFETIYYLFTPFYNYKEADEIVQWIKGVKQPMMVAAGLSI